MRSQHSDEIYWTDDGGDKQGDREGDGKDDGEGGDLPLWIDKNVSKSFLLFVEWEKVAPLVTKDVRKKEKTEWVASIMEEVANPRVVEVVVSKKEKMANEERTSIMMEGKKRVVIVPEQVIDKRSKWMSQYVVFSFAVKAKRRTFMDETCPISFKR